MTNTAQARRCRPIRIGGGAIAVDVRLDQSRTQCQTIIARLGLLLTGTNWNPEDFAKAHAEQGVGMWAMLAS